MDWFLNGDYASAPLDPRLVLLALLLGFVVGHVIAWSYILTHTGLSYSRSFANSLTIIPVIVALVIMLLSNNPVTAFGLLGVLTIVRFRNVLRDTFDTTYLLSAVALGLACGTLKFATAVLGCILLTAITLYLWYTDFGRRHRFDVLISVDWSRHASEIKELESLLALHSRRTQRFGRGTSEDGGLELSYRLLLRNPARVEELLDDLREARGVSRVAKIDIAEEAEI
jgi:hypothetical protein